MNDEDRGGALPVGEEDEFRGLGDDLLGQEAPPQAAGSPVQPKGPRVKKTLRQKALRVMLKRSGLSKPPLIERVLEGKTGPRIPISEIGFIASDKQDDPLMAELAQECPIRNRLNRDDVLKSRVLAVGTEIFKAQKMWTPIHVHRDLMDNRYECVSGRHRLAFLALVYGSNLEVPVYLEHLTLKAAREAVAVANDSRPVKALERASYAILRAVGGDSAADQDRLYIALAKYKPGVGKYCVYSVLERGYPAKLNFKLSERSSRPDGGITTVSNVEGFWGEALPWTREMSRKDFDEGLKDSVKFLNAFVSAIRKVGGFDPDQHLTANVLAAVGRYYQTYQNITSRNAIAIHEALAKAVVEIGQTGKKQQSEIYNAVAGCVAQT